MAKGNTRALTIRLALACCLSAPPAGWAIEPQLTLQQLHHTAWLRRDGAPGELGALAATRDGYLWMASSDGLVRFDGSRFELYRPLRGELPERDASVLTAAPGGGLWIGWSIGGASLLRDGAVRNFTAADGLQKGTVWGFAFDQQGGVWAAGMNGLSRYDGARWQQMGAQHGFTARKASAVFVDRHGTVAAFSEQGLFLMPKGAARFNPPIGKLDTRQPPQQDRHGRIYFLERRGIRLLDSLERYEDDSAWVYRDPAGESGSMLADSHGTLWFDGKDRLYRLSEPAAARAAPGQMLAPRTQAYGQGEGLSGSVVHSMLEDDSGTVWIATNKGLDRFRRAALAAVPASAPGVNLSGAELLPAGGDGMWLGMPSKNFPWTLARPDATFWQAQPPLPVAVSAALRGQGGELWLGGRAGVYRLEAGRENSRDGAAALRGIAYPPGEYKGHVHRLMQDRDGALWASIARGGVFRYSGGQWSRDGRLAPDAAFSMLGDSQGRQWFGYIDNRIAMLDGAAPARRHGSAEGLALGRVIVLREAAGRVWAGGTQGLALLRQERFVRVRSEPAALLEAVSSLQAAPDGSLWLLTGAGLLRISPEDVRALLADPGHAVRPRLFDEADGLQGRGSLFSDAGLALAGDGKLWVSTSSGQFWLDPLRLPRYPGAPAAQVLSVSAGGTLYRNSGGAALPVGTQNLQFDYSAPELAMPERTRFRYMLEGYDKDWQEAGARRQAFYTGLGPGSYRFRVMASSADGAWGQPGPAMAVTVPPAWYQTLWFRGLCAGLAGLALWGLYCLRVRQLAARLQAHLEGRQAERERIARELHDTLLQGIQGLILRFQAVALRVPAAEPLRLAMDAALDRAEQVLTEGRDRVHDLRQPEVLEKGVVRALEELGGALAAEHGAAFSMATSGRPRALCDAMEYDIYRIGSEALSNAAAHAQARTVALAFNYLAEGPELRVKDDGVGIAASVLEAGSRPGHWGLPGMRERAAQLGGRLEIASLPGQGTEVVLRIPAVSAYR